MNIQIQQFVVIDGSQALEDIKIGKRDYKYTVNGAKIYPIGGILPLIRKGHGCLGLVNVTKITITETITTVEFTMVEEGKYPAFYELYRNQITSSADSSSDSYDEYDQIVPGAFTATRSNESKVVKKAKKNKYNSVSAYINDDSDEDDDDLLYDRSERKRMQNSIFDRLTR